MKKAALILSLTVCTFQSAFALDSVAGQWKINQPPKCLSGKALGLKQFQEIAIKYINLFGATESIANEATNGPKVNMNGTLTFDSETSSVDIDVHAQVKSRIFNALQRNANENFDEVKKYHEGNPNLDPFSRAALIKGQQEVDAYATYLQRGETCTIGFPMFYKIKDSKLSLEQNVTVAFGTLKSDCPQVSRTYLYGLFDLTSADIEVKNDQLILKGAVQQGDEGSCAAGDRTVMVLQRK